MSDKNGAHAEASPVVLDRSKSTAERVAYERAKRYLEIKKQHGVNRYAAAKQLGVGYRTLDRNAAFARAVDAMPSIDRELVLEGMSGLHMEEVAAGAIPSRTETVMTVLRAKMKLRRQEETRERLYSPSLAIEDVNELADRDSQPTLTGLCQSVRELARLLSPIVTDADSLKALSRCEGWTQHTRHRVRANIQALRSDLSYLDHLLK
jgi:hypothetical protein